MEQLIVRIAKTEDAEFIALLARTTFTKTFGHNFRNKQEWYEAQHKTELHKTELTKSPITKRQKM